MNVGLLLWFVVILILRLFLNLLFVCCLVCILIEILIWGFGWLLDRLLGVLGFLNEKFFINWVRMCSCGVFEFCVFVVLLDGLEEVFVLVMMGFCFCFWVYCFVNIFVKSV